MINNYVDAQTNGVIQLKSEEHELSNSFVTEDVNTAVLTIAWNRGEDQHVTVDDQTVLLPNAHAIVMNVNQAFAFEHPAQVIAWQFNRGFYCIVDHDHEVSCAGLLFYGHHDTPVIKLSKEDQNKLEVLYSVFVEEFNEEDDNLKSEMLRVILKRLIVKLTRKYKGQFNAVLSSEKELDTIREFNVLVEQNFREYHQVQDYADLLHKSSKTISNLFSKFSSQSPLELIHTRLLLEAKRQLLYTDKTAKQIAFEIGFQDISGFSRFFKKHTEMSPSQFRNSHVNKAIGKN